MVKNLLAMVKKNRNFFVFEVQVFCKRYLDVELAIDSSQLSFQTIHRVPRSACC